MEEQELRDEIAKAFPAEPFAGRVTDCNCEECLSISEGLRNKKWIDVPNAFVDFTCSPTLLTPAAFQAFVPVYLLRSLDLLPKRRSPVVEFTVYSLTPSLPDDGTHGYKNEGLKECATLMSAAQIVAIRVFLLFVRDHVQDPEWLREFIDPALTTVWRMPPAGVESKS